jgi:hypothetical protein
MKRCFRCRKGVDTPEGTSRRDECPHCGADLHVCLNCEFYEEGRANACREPQVEPVKEKDRANFCDYFRFREDGASAASGKKEAEQLWEQLFKK